MAARVALLRILGVPAEGRGAAVTNRLEGLPLLRTEYVSPVREENFFVRAKDVGHFEPTFVHSRVGGERRSGLHQVERVDGFEWALGRANGDIA